jgi:DNA polymerase III delta prime subunit
MRQALNNLQATYSGFGKITAANVFEVIFHRIIDCRL